MMPPTVTNDAARVASLAGRWICVTGDGGWSSLLVLFGSCPAHAFAGEFDAVGVVNETVQDGVSDYFVPSVDWKLGANHCGAASGLRRREAESWLRRCSPAARAGRCPAWNDPCRIRLTARDYHLGAHAIRFCCPKD